jgi:hypothetical protein
VSRPVLISGGTGLIGSRLIESLCEAGTGVRVLSRRARSTTEFRGARVEALQWDGVKLPSGALHGCSAVIHLAGEPVFGGPLTAKRRRLIVSSRIDSTRSIAEALCAAPAADRPSAFVCASAVGFYGSRGDDLLDESASPGTGFLSTVCQQWETSAQAAAGAGVRVVSLRTGIVLSRRGGALPLMALPFRLGIGGRLGDGRQWVPWIQIDDAVSLIAATLRDENFEGPVNVVAPNPVRNGELTTALAATLRRPALLPAPTFALKLGMGELSQELLGSRRCVAGRAAERDFQFTHTEVETALQAELADSRT